MSFPQKINYDVRRIEWNEVQSKRNLTISTLLILKALRSDEGTYTCVDTYNITQHIVLHIFDGMFENIIHFECYVLVFLSLFFFISRHVS